MLVEIQAYNVAMSYVIAMRSQEGVLFASDGLGRFAYPGQEEHASSPDFSKIFPLSKNLLIGFAGVIPGVDNFVSIVTRNEVIEDIEQYALDITRSAHKYSLEAMRERNSDLQMIIVAYSHKAAKCRIFSSHYANGTQTEEVDSFVDIGYKNEVSATALQEYTNSDKSIDALEAIAKKAVKDSAAANPKEVGGKTFMYHIDKNRFTVKKT